MLLFVSKSSTQTSQDDQTPFDQYSQPDQIRRCQSTFRRSTETTRIDSSKCTDFQTTVYRLDSSGVDPVDQMVRDQGFPRQKITQLTRTRIPSPSPVLPSFGLIRSQNFATKCNPNTCRVTGSFQSAGLGLRLDLM